MFAHEARIKDHAGCPVVVDGAHALPPNDLTVMSYNVLLPNSQDGWWIYKYFDASVPPEARTWAHRSALLQAQLLDAGADVICLQEVSPESFAQDFAFLTAAGYDHELLNKGRMRCATFFKSDRFQLLHTFCKDRTLTIELCSLCQRGQDAGACADASGDCSQEGCKDAAFFVVNCHLSAGPQAKRRLKQVHEAVDTIRKLTQRRSQTAAHAARAAGAHKDKGKGKGKAAASAAAATDAEELLRHLAVIVAGDFNSQGATAVRELLVHNAVAPDFRERGDPTERHQAETAVTSKAKRHVLSPFADAYALAFGEAVPPTLVCRKLDVHMVDLETDELLPECEAQIRRMFDALSNDGGQSMNRSDVESWLLLVNKKLGRGSEFRAAEALLQAKSDAGKTESLTFSDFRSIYAAEMSEGKWWGVEHDLTAVNGSGLAVSDEDPFTARFDQIYFTAGPLTCTHVRTPLSRELQGKLYSEPHSNLPNAWHPSDHLPLLASFRFNVRNVEVG